MQLCFLGWKSLSINSIHFNMYLSNTNHVFSHEHGTMGDIKEEHITQSPQYKGACNLAERRGDGGSIYEAIGGKSKYDVKQRVNPKPPNVWDNKDMLGNQTKERLVFTEFLRKGLVEKMEPN